MIEILENEMLDDLFEIRREGFECLIVRKYKESEEEKRVNRTEREMLSEIRKVVKNEEGRDKLISKMYEFHDAMLGEMEYWNKSYYKYALIEGILLEEEVKDKIKELKNSVDK